MKGMKNMDMATQRLIQRWLPTFAVIFAVCFIQYLLKLVFPKSVVFLITIGFILYLVLGDYVELKREYAPRNASKSRRLAAEKDPFTPQMMHRLRRMQKLGLSAEAMALQAGTSEARVRLKLGMGRE